MSSATACWTSRPPHWACTSHRHRDGFSPPHAFCPGTEGVCRGREIVALSGVRAPAPRIPGIWSAKSAARGSMPASKPGWPSPRQLIASPRSSPQSWSRSCHGHRQQHRIVACNLLLVVARTPSPPPAVPGVQLSIRTQLLAFGRFSQTRSASRSCDLAAWAVGGLTQFQAVAVRGGGCCPGGWA